MLVIMLCAVLVASLRAQLDPAHATGKLSAMLHFNVDRVVNRTRCQAAAWVPGTQGGAFVSAHFDGQFHIYHKVFERGSGPQHIA